VESIWKAGKEGREAEFPRLREARLKNRRSVKTFIEKRKEARVNKNRVGTGIDEDRKRVVWTPLSSPRV